MGFTAHFVRTDLEKAVALCMPAVATTNQLDIIKGIRLTADTERKKVVFNAFDLSKGIIAETDAIIEEPGSIVIPGVKLMQAVKNLTNDIVKITASEKCTLQCGKSKVTVPYHDGSGFPNIPQMVGDNAFHVSAFELLDSMKKTAYAADKANARAVLNGIYFEFKANDSEVSMRLCGTDSFRISSCTKRLRHENAENVVNYAAAIVPIEAILAFVKMLDNTDTECDILITAKHIIFQTVEFTFFTRLIDGQYINAEQFIASILPTSFLTVETDELRAALQRAALVTEERQIGMTKAYVRLESGNGGLIVTTDSASGSTYDELEAVVEGEPMVIGFSNSYLLDAVKAIHTEKVHFSFKSASSAALIRPVLAESDRNKFSERKQKNGLIDEDQIHLVLPVRMSKR